MIKMQQLQQEAEKTEIEQYAEKIERAKKLFQLYSNITFGDKIESAKSRCILGKFNIK